MGPGLSSRSPKETSGHLTRTGGILSFKEQEEDSIVQEKRPKSNWTPQSVALDFTALIFLA
jgi:hypothetical protein